MAQVVWITGASSGLGLHTAQALARNGFTVVAGARSFGKGKTVAGCHCLPLDVTSEESIEKAYETVRGITYRLDAVVNFAGIHTFTSMVEGDCVHEIEKMLDVNVMGMVRVNKRFFEMVRIGHGRIVNCSSESGWMTPQPFNGPYTMTKYAVEAYNDSLRR